MKPAESTGAATEHKIDIVDNKINSESLFRNQNIVIIEHGEKQYQLRHTRQGKLILTL